MTDLFVDSGPGVGHAPGRTVRVALAGAGTVGGALLRLLQERAAAIREADGVSFRVARVLVRDPSLPRAVPVPPAVLTTDPDRFLETDADLVVEAIGGIDDAGRVARATLGAGRSFITANKALIADRGPELEELARVHGGRLAYEAAVAGGVPVIRVLREALAQTGIVGVRGILNGTTNFILSRMATGRAFTDALAEARELGFAEANPSRDLNGHDAADKIAILAWEAFGIAPGRLRIRRTGLLPDPDRIVADANALGGTARLLAEAVRGPDGVTATVEPVVVPHHSAFAHTPGEENMVAIETRTGGTIRIAGPGAGGGPTASALLSDMLGATRRSRHGEAPSAPDRRGHRWAVRVRGNGRGRSAIERAADRARIPITATVPNPTGTRIVTGPTSRTRATLFTRVLEATGLEPVRLRLDVRDRHTEG